VHRNEHLLFVDNDAITISAVVCAVDYFLMRILERATHTIKIMINIVSLIDTVVLSLTNSSDLFRVHNLPKPVQVLMIRVQVHNKRVLRCRVRIRVRVLTFVLECQYEYHVYRVVHIAIKAD